MAGDYRDRNPGDEYGRSRGGYGAPGAPGARGSREWDAGGGYEPPASVQTEVNAGRLWAGGVAAAVVAALIALVGVLVARALFQLAVLSPKHAGTLSDDATTSLCIIAAVAALLATGLAHLLLVSTPSPLSYFGWIVGLLTVAAVVIPFLGSDPLPLRFAEAVIHAVIGMAIGGLVSNAAATASRLALRGNR